MFFFVFNIIRDNYEISKNLILFFIIFIVVIYYNYNRIYNDD